MLFLLFGFIIGLYVGFSFLAYFILPVGTEHIINFRLLPQEIPVRTLLLSSIIPGLFGILGALGAYAHGTKKALRESMRKWKEASDVSKTKDEFISMVLHHLRTPLSGIRWSIKEILKEISADNPLRKDLDLLNGENMRALIAAEHLIEASQASMGRIEYHFQVFSIEELLAIIAKSIEAMRSLLKEKGLTIEVQLSTPSEASVKIDKEKITTIVQSLLENAIQYTPKGGVITVRTEERDFNFFFHITDTGIGIPKEEQPRVFLQFFRGKTARQIEPGGFGIGLFLAKIFIENQNGGIWFVSKERQGTTFSFRLPFITASTEKFLEQIS